MPELIYIMSSEQKETAAGLSILTEAKLHFNRNQQQVTVKKKTEKYVDELWLKFLMEAGVLDGYKLMRGKDGAEVELTFAVEEK